MSVITPFFQMNAWRAPLAVSLQPTMTPKALMPRASLFRPPSVPRFRFLPSFQRTAR